MQQGESNLTRSSGAVAVGYDYESDQVLMEPYYYLLQVPGKQIRSMLIDAFNQWLHVEQTLTTSISDIIQMLHTASLLYVGACGYFIGFDFDFLMRVGSMILRTTHV
jgi:geranylgeranyl pyrophosphate synthase